jgi:hypothetical protein
VTIDPEVAAILAALIFGFVVSLPKLQRRAREVRECLRCGRIRVLGERTCDCDD